MLMFPNIVAFLFFPNCQKQDISIEAEKWQLTFRNLKSIVTRFNQ